MLGVVRVTRRAYAVDEWGVGELWVAGGVVIHHALPGGVPSTAADATAAPRPTLPDSEPPPRRWAPAGPASPPGGAKPPDESLRASRRSDGAAFASALCDRFVRHLAGERTAYEDVGVDLEWATPFQGDLVRALRAVPWGEVVTYGELAALGGRPRAARAAGAMCADNRFALIVPCHRVVASGGIGGYGDSGVALKRRLLALEGVTM